MSLLGIVPPSPPASCTCLQNTPFILILALLAFYLFIHIYICIYVFFYFFKCRMGTFYFFSVSTPAADLVIAFLLVTWSKSPAKPPASHLDLLLFVTFLKTSSSPHKGLDFYVWGCYGQTWLRKIPCQDCCFHHRTGELWHVAHSSQGCWRRRENIIGLDRADASRQHVEHYNGLLSFLDHSHFIWTQHQLKW